jgi:hypothetical protein
MDTYSIGSQQRPQRRRIRRCRGSDLVAAGARREAAQKSYSVWTLSTEDLEPVDLACNSILHREYSSYSQISGPKTTRSISINYVSLHAACPTPRSPGATDVETSDSTHLER